MTWIWVDGDAVREDGSRASGSRVSSLRAKDATYAHMLDPRWLTAGRHLCLVGARVVADRRRYDVSSTGFSTFTLLPGADGERHTDDAETGLVLRSAALCAGKPLLVEEFVELEVDVQIDPRVFSPSRRELQVPS